MHAVINLNKPKGITSQDAVIRVKKLMAAKKAGHAGTLDPIAEGVLLVCLDEATKITSFLSELDKQYIATLKLGESTDTFDSEGRVLRKKGDFFFREADIDEVLEGMKGTIEQTPPMYSAIKHKGRPLYEFARKGIEIQRQKRLVNIYDLSIKRLDLPFLELSVTCSKGTYIRSLADDIGNALRVGAHIVELKRVRIGDFRAEDGAGLKDVPSKEASCRTVDSALGHLMEVVLDEEDFALARNGIAIPQDKYMKSLPDLIAGGTTPFLRLKDPDGRLFGIGMTVPSSLSQPPRIKLKRLLHLT